MTAELILRLFVASVLGSAIGFERGYRAKEAGFRTHFLVAMGSALFMIISQYGFEQVLTQATEAHLNIRLDPSRIAAQVVSGIGFIGAGTIIFQRHVVRGLTTAAGLWVTSAIGMTCGAGLYLLATACTVLVLICLETLNYFFQRFGTRNISITFSSPSIDNVRQVLDRMRQDDMVIDSYNMREKDGTSGLTYTVTVEVNVKRDRYDSRVLGIMKELDGIRIESIE